MYENLGGRLCIDDMARTAIFSKFHFSRVFHQVTGLSPGRFLSAIRLQAAKRLLCSTSLSVTDICFEVGYNSVGTFSSRFKATVGVSPSLYRQRCGLVSRLRVSRRSDWGTSSTLVEGEVWLPDMNVGSIFVGAFPEPIMQGLPIRYHVLHQPGPYALDDLPRGTWHILATASFPGEEGSVRDPVHDDPPPVVAACGPVVVGHPGAQLSADLHLRPMRITDPPVLLALPDVRWSYEPAEDLAEDLIEHSA
ncbi:MAG TPA: helix-turn-helix transcriptional regulator [Streptosporangiaceae bacterium]|nr:helix-turn-helix transcriptional regulator [Streptosporangiaceae bacterium]